MAAIGFKFLWALLGLYILNQGYAKKCGPSDIRVTQSKTGEVVEGQSQFEVTISNTCACPQSNVKIGCSGFSSVGPSPNPSVFRMLDDSTCIVNDGKPIANGSPVKFTYAFATPSDLPVVGADPSC
ncbi:TPD1 protein homolog 1 [Amborella trichopoda]|uniref:Uncharacterized protein n=1 Tax=Amborella trichopoda TaxID=13333 RepID=W1PF86_AMBTC|nr:TPD1 protein homolog 1 [Amborella trichopoda]ERN06291.1 hypothetical protein AMTR_s00016p00223460 [Amborella trichopoda]|eukprot:XP_006844616.1 TPD1 protein homolog 1 [Amborella trichopoda]